MQVYVKASMQKGTEVHMCYENAMWTYLHVELMLGNSGNFTIILVVPTTIWVGSYHNFTLWVWLYYNNKANVPW
jgi:hypothetical protein